MSDATNNQPLLNNPSAMKEFLLLMDYTYALLCLACGAKVLDPDKKKNQTYLNGKCPSCGQMSKPHKPILENIIEGLTGKSKKQQKKEAKRQRREEKKQEKRRIAELRKHNRRDNDRVVAL